MSIAPSAAVLSGAAARRRWCLEARVLASADPSAVPRLGLSDAACIGRLPDWVAAEPSARTELALLVGAVLCASALRRTVDGRVLGPVSAALGSDRLTALAALRPPAAPKVGWIWTDDPVGALTALGGEGLVRVAARPDAVARRLAACFGPSDALGDADLAALGRAVEAARMMWRPAVTPGEVRT